MGLSHQNNAKACGFDKGPLFYRFSRIIQWDPDKDFTTIANILKPKMVTLRLYRCVVWLKLKILTMPRALIQLVHLPIPKEGPKNWWTSWNSNEGVTGAYMITKFMFKIDAIEIRFVISVNNSIWLITKWNKTWTEWKTARVLVQDQARKTTSARAS